MQRGLAGLRDEERFGPWVYQVARSAVAAKHRGPTSTQDARGRAAAAHEVRAPEVSHFQASSATRGDVSGWAGGPRPPRAGDAGRIVRDAGG
jgi:hypothetical protein